MRSTRSSSAAFTLVELMVACTLGAILMGAMVSAVMIGARALPSKSPAPAAADAAARASAATALATLNLEMATARSIIDLQPSSITFMVPDRDGDGAEDKLIYAWDETKGNPLTRSMNGGAASVVLPQVAAFTLQGDYRTATTTIAGADTTSAEKLLWQGVNTGTTRVDTVKNKESVAQSFVARLPKDATSFSLTRVKIHLRGRGNTFYVQLRPSTLGTPGGSGSTIASVTLSDSALGNLVGSLLGSLLGSSQWVSIPLPAANLTPGTEYAIVVAAAAGGGDAVTITTSNQKLADDYATWSTHADESAQTRSSDATMFLEVYGTVRRPSVTTTTQDYLIGLQASLSASTSANALARTTIRLPFETPHGPAVTVSTVPADLAPSELEAAATLADERSEGN